MGMLVGIFPQNKYIIISIFKLTIDACQTNPAIIPLKQERKFYTSDVLVITYILLVVGVSAST